MTCAGLCAQAHRYISCPTCRQRVRVSDIAYVDSGRAVATEASGSLDVDEEGKQVVKGSYSTKVSI